MQHLALKRFGEPDLAGLRDKDDAVGARYAVIAENVQIVAEGIRPFRVQLAPHRRAGRALRNAGVPACGNILAQERQEIGVERILFAVVVPVDAVDTVSIFLAPVALGEQVEVVEFLWRVFDAHSELGLRP